MLSAAECPWQHEWQDWVCTMTVRQACEGVGKDEGKVISQHLQLQVPTVTIGEMHKRSAG